MFGDDAALIGGEAGNQNPRTALQNVETSLQSFWTALQNGEAALQNGETALRCRPAAQQIREKFGIDGKSASPALSTAQAERSLPMFVSESAAP
jgi:hypothetical protein